MRPIKVTALGLMVISLIATMPSVLAAFYWNLGLVAWNQATSSRKDLEAIYQARQLWEQALTLQPGQPDLLLYLGATYEWIGEEEKALSTWRQLEHPLDALITTGQPYLANGLSDVSLLWFRGASEIAPDVGDPWYYIAQALVQMGHPEEALVALDKALQTERLEDVRRSQIFLEKGDIYHRKIQPRQLEDAADAYRAALASRDSPTAMLEAEIHFRLGEVLRWKGEHPDLYIAECQKAIALNPGHSHAHILLGVAYYAKYHDVEKAEKEILLAMEIAPQNPWGPWHLGIHIYEPAGMIGEAVEAYRWTLRIDPQFEPAKQALQQLQK